MSPVIILNEQQLAELAKAMTNYANALLDERRGLGHDIPEGSIVIKPPEVQQLIDNINDSERLAHEAIANTIERNR